MDRLKPPAPHGRDVFPGRWPGFQRCWPTALFVILMAADRVSISLYVAQKTVPFTDAWIGRSGRHDAVDQQSLKEPNHGTTARPVSRPLKTRFILADRHSRPIA